MSAIAAGVFKQLTQKRQTALGTVAPGGAATGTYVRRTKSTIDLTKKTFKSAEILVSQQRRDFRHGVRSVAGTISGELSVGGYQAFMESICRQVVQAIATSGAVATITAAVTSGAAGTFTCTGINWLTQGFKIGDVVTSTGWATTGVPNNGHYSIITALTGTVMTVLFIDGVAMGPKAAGDTVTLVTVGKKTWIPATGQVKHYYTIEHWFGDIAQSELFTDCVITEMQVKLPATGMATVDFPVMGLNITENTSQYFSSPTAAPTGGIEAAVNGFIFVQGVVIGYITAADFTVKGNYSAIGGVVGATVDPDIFPGVVDVTGNLTVLFQDATFADYFENETEVQIVLLLTSTAAGPGYTSTAPGFTCFNFPRCKLGGMTKDDGEKQITQTMPFTALEQTAGGATTGTSYDTTMSIQDYSFA